MAVNAENAFDAELARLRAAVADSAARRAAGRWIAAGPNLNLILCHFAGRKGCLRTAAKRLQL